MKMPNRTGSVCKLSGKRRKPYMARLYTPTGYVILGYYRLKSEATTAIMMAATRRPDPPQSPMITLENAFNEWRIRKYQTITSQYAKQYTFAYFQLKPLHKRPISSISVKDIEQTVEAANPSGSCRETIKNLLNQVFRYAIAHDYTDRNPATLIDIKTQRTTKVIRKPFTFSEVSSLFNKTDTISQMILIGCYTGMRPNEILSLSVEEIDLETQMLRIHGSKTKSGLSRVIPIHPAILSTITEKSRKSAELGLSRLFLTNRLGHPMTYDTYLLHLHKLDHTPHDTRHTFATFARSSGMDPLAVKRILGHSSSDITEQVYTHTDEAYLMREMRKFVII